MTSTSTLSRAEYLKRYMSSSSKTTSSGTFAGSRNEPDKKKKSKKSTNADTSSSIRGMRLLDDDTYGQSKPGSSKQRRKPVDSEDEDNIGSEEEDEEMDEIEKAVRRMNRRTATARRANKSGDKEEPMFKADSFISVEGPNTTKTAGSTEETDDQFDPNRVKKEIKEEATSDQEEENRTRPRKKGKMDRMDDGGRAGLVTKQAMKEEMLQRKEREQKQQQDMERAQKADSGQREERRGGEAEAENTRIRKTGFDRDARKRRQKEGENEEDMAAKEARKQREAAKQTELDEKYSKWNRGVAQLKQREEKLAEMEQTLGEGFTRYSDDKGMNEHLKEQLHEDDPMAQYFRVKNHKVQMRSGVVYPTYKGQWPINRYGIAPGYRWDGVNRSNGFESKLSLEKNRKMALEKDAYRSIGECE